MAEENQNEEPVFKVADKRKFNLDGSLREGAAIEPAKPAATETATAAAPQNNFAAEPQTDQPAAAAIDRSLNDLTGTSAAFNSNQEPATGAMLDDLSADYPDETALGDDGEVTDETEIPGADDPPDFGRAANAVRPNRTHGAGAAPPSGRPAFETSSAEIFGQRYFRALMRVNGEQ